MDTSDIPNREASLWLPITNRADVAVLGKLGEEVTECGTAIFRCIIQGADEKEPVTNKLNREWLEEEIADVMAMLEHTVQHFGLSWERMDERTRRKFNYTAPWFEKLKAINLVLSVRQQSA
jgi:hypothetical protein